MSELIKCKHCGAQYKPGHWCVVAYEGTSSVAEFVRRIPDGHCPICRKPADPDPTP